MSLTDWELKRPCPFNEINYSISKTLCFIFFSINILEYLRQFIEDYKILNGCKFGFYIDDWKIYLVT